MWTTPCRGSAYALASLCVSTRFPKTSDEIRRGVFVLCLDSSLSVSGNEVKLFFCPEEQTLEGTKMKGKRM